MSILKDRVNKIGEKREAGRKSAPVGERARVGSTNNLESKLRQDHSTLTCIQPATARITQKQYAYRPLILKPNTTPTISEIKLKQKIQSLNYNRCTIVYTDNFESFYNTYNQVKGLKEYEEILVNEVLIADSGEVPKNYIANNALKKSYAILSDKDQDTLILQGNNSYQVFYNSI
jgi:hypothetical protein